MPKSYVNDLMKDKLYAVLLLNGRKRDGRKTYVYLSVRLDHLDALVKEYVAGRAVRIADVGKILAHGFGEPSEAVKRHIEETYGFDHDDVISMSGKVPTQG